MWEKMHKILKKWKVLTKTPEGEKWFFESVWKEDNPEEKQRAGVNTKGQVSGKHFHR